MPAVLPQQLLLLELLQMSGDIAVADDIEDSILERTLKEVEQRGWVGVKHIGNGFNKVYITGAGRTIVDKHLDRRSTFPA